MREQIHTRARTLFARHANLNAVRECVGARTRDAVKERGVILYKFIHRRFACAMSFGKCRGNEYLPVSGFAARNGEFVTQYRTHEPRTTIYFDRHGIGSLRNDTSARYNIDFIGPLRRTPAPPVENAPVRSEWNGPYKRDRIRRVCTPRDRGGKGTGTNNIAAAMCAERTY